jgi:outer membrane protein TolC
VVNKALDGAPELQSSDSLLDANDILRRYHKRRFFVPEALMEFGYDRTLDQTYDNPPGFQGSGGLLPEDKKDHWALQFKLEWSFFQGGGQIVDIRKDLATRKKLESLHREAAEIIEERARNALIRASTARSDMDLARQAAQAAHKNYKVSRNGYAEGTASILDLLDAQREARMQERKAVVAEYRYLKAVVAVERSMNRVAALVPEKDQKAWWNELKARLGKEWGDET